jgi:hypothetical protein
MYNDLLMHVSAAHIQNNQRAAESRRQVREARRNVKARAVKPQRRLRWHLRRSPARPVSPAS